MLGTPCAAGLTVGAEAGAASPAPARLLDDSPCPPGHNTPFPLKRSPPGSFKRLLDGAPSAAPLALAPLDGRVIRTEVGEDAEASFWRNEARASLRRELSAVQVAPHLAGLRLHTELHQFH